MKLRHLHIEDYKMFKDFDISFVDENDEPLPIIVLAGVNGSGKTTLLEVLAIQDNIVGKIKINNKEMFLSYDSENGKFARNRKKALRKRYENNIILFNAETDKIYEVEKEFKKLFYNYLKNHDYRPSEVKGKLESYINGIFEGLDINFKYSHLDKNDNVYFSNIENKEFRINELSTGEKILLSKILYLFFQDYKNAMILIDEPELSLHPSWQNRVLKIYENFAKQNNCQIIIATHSPHIIGSAKNEYLRFLSKDDEGNIKVDNLMAYGRDIEWILEQMGVTDTRLPKITKRFEEIQELINNEEFDKADDALDKLEYVIGENDKGILALRNDLAFERMDFEEDN